MLNNNLASRNCQRLLTFWQNDQISPNLVTLSGLWGECAVYLLKMSMFFPTSVTRYKIYFFIIWLFTTANICPKAHKICQSTFKIVPNTKINPQNVAKITKCRQIWSHCPPPHKLVKVVATKNWKLVQSFFLSLSGKSWMWKCKKKKKRWRRCWSKLGKLFLDRQKSEENARPDFRFGGKSQEWIILGAL